MYPKNEIKSVHEYISKALSSNASREATGEFKKAQ